MGKSHWGLAAAMLVTAVGAGVFFGLWRPQPPGVTPIPGTGVVYVAPGGGEKADQARETEIVVHVSGRVFRPGLVRVSASARVGDVIVAAGGALADARLDEINLAAPVSDGVQVVVPGPGTRLEAHSAGSETANGSSGLVSLNRASVGRLEDIPGVGPVLAQRIVHHRQTNGPFREVEDLLDVSGIGERKLADLRQHVALP
ncbi:MAG: ComEA family DNA-binding protein [Acidimicrobiia bacterium]|nr:ComEA family DNA-binding protein [bacterium]MXY74192.1 ComEA family DNA-binding protein [Acidimicrobiia bacterium]MYD40184.1 ComEA family DNA-binding protein [Acidimicrobiia bacterium]